MRRRIGIAAVMALATVTAVAAVPREAAAQRYEQRGQRDWGAWDQRYGRGYGYGSDFGFQAGYADGFEKGIEDARKHRSFNARRHGWYRDGDRRYRREYGPRDLYKRAYRSGFVSGYQRGFREAPRYGYRVPRGGVGFGFNWRF